MRSRLAGVTLSLVTVAVLAAGCSNAGQQPAQKDQAAAPAHDRAADEAAIRANDSALGKAVAAKSTQQVMTYYTSDAVLMPVGLPVASGADAISKTWSGFLATPGAAASFAPDKIVVSGDLAYEVGTYALTSNDKKGKPQTATGKYVVVWSRQADGTWKAVVDAATTAT